MAIGVKFVDVKPSSVEGAKDVQKENVKNFMFSGSYVSDLVGKKHEHEGFIYMLVQGTTGGVELGGSIAMVVLRPIVSATEGTTYRLVSYTPMTLELDEVVIFLRNGDFKVVHRDDCGMI